MVSRWIYFVPAAFVAAFAFWARETSIDFYGVMTPVGIMAATVAGLNLYFLAIGVPIEQRYVPGCRAEVSGMQFHHSLLGAMLAAGAFLAGLDVLGFIGLGVVVQHLLFEDLPNRSLAFIERRRGGWSVECWPPR